MRVNCLFGIILLCISALPGYSQGAVLRSFPLQAVRLHESPFKQAQQVDMAYMLAMDPDRLLAPYLREAGIPTTAKPYGNWENTGLDGHIGGHYLTALSLMYASTGNAELLQRLNYMVDQLEACQQKNGKGYIGGIPGGEAMWQEVAQGNIQAENFSLNNKWVPWYNIHKVYAGLHDAHVIGGNAKAKGMLIKLSDWCLNLVAGLSDAQLQDMLRSEHGGMNEVFADVAALTGDAKYLQLARRFSDLAILDPLLAGKDELTGLHANTQIPKVIGYKRVADLAQDKEWDAASAFFWETVVGKRTVSFGGNSVREHFHPATDFSEMLESKEGPETCNTYNMLKLSKQLFLSSTSSHYLDYYERGLYNHILSSQHPERGGFVYFTPIRPRHYRVYSQPEENFWCCVGSGLENHGKYGELIYAHNSKDLFVNLFIPSTLEWKEKGITLEQNTRFPYEEDTRLTVQTNKPQKITLYIRQPQWLAGGPMQVKVNGKSVKHKTDKAGYIGIERTWKKGDYVNISLPMVTRAEPLPDGSDWVSFMHGPLVLAAVTDTNKNALPGLQADGSRMGHIANGALEPLEEAPLLVTDQKQSLKLRPVQNKALTFSLANQVEPGQYQNLELVPFFQVHDARYMLYWPVASPDSLAAIKQKLSAKESEKRALAAITVDEVAPGEQQPESDHGYQGHNTESGVHKDRHWRHAKGWFSYVLKNPAMEARKLRITYYGLDSGRTFDIYVNQQKLATVQMDGSQGDHFYDVDYPLPANLLNTNPATLTVKFAAHDGSVAGGIYYVRLLK
jgi:uncharacterized protein